MAKRMVDTELWNDEDIIENFTARDKYFWLYLLTNPHNNICGVLKNSPSLIARDMSLNKDIIINLIERFETIHKAIVVDKDTAEICIVNWNKYNWTKSQDLLCTIQRTLQTVQSKKIKTFLEEKLYKKFNIERVDGVGTVPPRCRDGVGTVIGRWGDGTNTNTTTKNNIYNNDAHTQEHKSFIPYLTIKQIVDKQCPILAKRLQTDIDSGKIYLVDDIERLVEEQGLSEQDLERLFAHVSKTYICKPNFKLGVKWVLENIRKALDAAEDYSGNDYNIQGKLNGTNMRDSPRYYGEFESLKDEDI